jgi:L-lysine 6-transaminase
LDQVPNNVFQESSRINSTFGGNLIDMLRFKMILEVIEQENLLENVNVQGKFLKSELHKLEGKYENVTNVRGMGLFLAFDLPSDEERNAFIKKAFENKLIILPCGIQSVRFRPHLNVTREDLEKAVEIIDSIL